MIAYGWFDMVMRLGYFDFKDGVPRIICYLQSRHERHGHTF